MLSNLTAGNHMKAQVGLMKRAEPMPRARIYARRFEDLSKPKKVVRFGGSNDPEVCCIDCGAILGQNSISWWDEDTCSCCHETR